MWEMARAVCSAVRLLAPSTIASAINTHRGMVASGEIAPCELLGGTTNPRKGMRSSRSPPRLTGGCSTDGEHRALGHSYRWPVLDARQQPKCQCQHWPGMDGRASRHRRVRSAGRGGCRTPLAWLRRKVAARGWPLAADPPSPPAATSRPSAPPGETVVQRLGDPPACAGGSVPAAASAGRIGQSSAGGRRSRSGVGAVFA